jgi:hypothetical protein
MGHILSLGLKKCGKTVFPGLTRKNPIMGECLRITPMPAPALAPVLSTILSLCIKPENSFDRRGEGGLL